MRKSSVKTRSAKDATPKINSTLGLAKYLGLSQWTVSRAINGHPEVKASTRERILQAMEKVGFRPNPVARGLSGKAMGIVGVCFGYARSEVMIDKIVLLDTFLRKNHLRGILAISPIDQESEIRILEDFRHLRVDGIVSVQSTLRADQFSKTIQNIPCVYIDPSDRDLGPNVSVYRDEAMYLITKHLIELGHRSFGVLFERSDFWRWKGFHEAFREYGLDPQKQVQTYELEDIGPASFAEGIELGKKIIQARKRPTALITLNDRMAMGVIQQIRDEGFRVPDDFSVVGFDNLSIGQYLHPTITTIDLQPETLIEKTGQILLEQLGKLPATRPSHNVKIEPRLIVRQSTGPAPKHSCK